MLATNVLIQTNAAREITGIVYPAIRHTHVLGDIAGCILYADKKAPVVMMLPGLF